MRSLPLKIAKRLTRLDLMIDVVDHLPISRSLLSINPVLQTGSTSALGHTYGVDEDVLSLFQRVADVVDPPRNPSSTTAWWWWRKHSCRASPKPPQDKEGERMAARVWARVVLRLGSLGVRLGVPLCPLLYVA